MYDAVIVGAGPAGNTAALELSKLGFNVVVLDYRERIGDKLCTGVIGMECSDRFPVPPELIYRQTNTAAIYSPSGRVYRVERPDTQALIVDRVGYVNSIAAAAARNGAEYRLGWRAGDIFRSSKDIGVTSHRGGTSEMLRGRILIIASGFGSSLTETVCPTNGSGRPRLVGTQVEVVTRNVTETEVYVGDTIAPGSFGWLVPTNGSHGLLGLMSQEKSSGRLERLCDRLVNDGKVLGMESPPRRWGIPIKPLSKTHAERTLVLGDAAGFAKPTTGGGIYYAMLSGKIAAETASEALASNTFSDDALGTYEERWKAEFGSELRIGYYARLLFESLTDARLESLMEVFLSEEMQKELIRSPIFSFDRHSGIITKTVGHRRVLDLIRSAGPSVLPFLARLAKSSASP
ncbi:MAG: NAD(P)/FAD-dependent oxidoreductase [Dehalococcoidia bacterium]|nr:NAD(P)/FAD-dependent oxidoreductase [Dehalococcoidia bacterium]